MPGFAITVLPARGNQGQEDIMEILLCLLWDLADIGRSCFLFSYK